MLYLEFVDEINLCRFANAYYNMLTLMIFNAYSDFAMTDSEFSSIAFVNIMITETITNCSYAVPNRDFQRNLYLKN